MYLTVEQLVFGVPSMNFKVNAGGSYADPYIHC